MTLRHALGLTITMFSEGAGAENKTRFPGCMRYLYSSSFYIYFFSTPDFNRNESENIFLGRELEETAGLCQPGGRCLALLGLRFTLDLLLRHFLPALEWSLCFPPQPAFSARLSESSKIQEFIIPAGENQLRNARRCPRPNPPGTCDTWDFAGGIKARALKQEGGPGQRWGVRSNPTSSRRQRTLSGCSWILQTRKVQRVPV